MSVLYRDNPHTHEASWNPEQDFVAAVDCDEVEHPYDELDSLLTSVSENLVLAGNLEHDEWYALTEDEVESVADPSPLLGLDTWEF